MVLLPGSSPSRRSPRWSRAGSSVTVRSIARRAPLGGKDIAPVIGSYREAGKVGGLLIPVGQSHFSFHPLRRHPGQASAGSARRDLWLGQDPGGSIGPGWRRRPLAWSGGRGGGGEG